MEKLLSAMVGKTVDVGCGTTAIFRGEVVEANGGVLSIKDEDARVTYIAIEKISSISERADSHSRPGFIA